jgi:hypothetical protein
VVEIGQSSLNYLVFLVLWQSIFAAPRVNLASRPGDFDDCTNLGRLVVQ